MNTISALDVRDAVSDAQAILYKLRTEPNTPHPIWACLAHAQTHIERELSAMLKDSTNVD